MPRLILLNGPPAVGKSTMASRWAEAHPGTLNLDIDRLRTMIGGWETYDEAPALSRTAGLALATAYLGTGHDVVVPQLVARRDQLDRFRNATAAAGSAFVCVLLSIAPDEGVARFRERDASAAEDDRWAQYVRSFWPPGSLDEDLVVDVARLDAIAAEDPTVIRVPSTDPDTTYDALVAAVG